MRLLKFYKIISDGLDVFKISFAAYFSKICLIDDFETCFLNFFRKRTKFEKTLEFLDKIRYERKMFLFSKPISKKCFAKLILKTVINQSVFPSYNFQNMVSIRTSNTSYMLPRVFQNPPYISPSYEYFKNIYKKSPKSLKIPF